MTSPPTPDPSHLPDPSPQAFSAYFFVMNFLNLTDTSMPLEAVKQELARYCSTPWSQVGHAGRMHRHLRLLTLTLSPVLQVRQQHPGVKVKYLAAYCFSGAYILTLLTEGYNFTSESYSSIKFIKKVGGGGLSHTHTHRNNSEQLHGPE